MEGGVAARDGFWYRTGAFFANGRQPTWEYPRATRDVGFKQLAALKR